MIRVRVRAMGTVSGQYNAAIGFGTQTEPESEPNPAANGNLDESIKNVEFSHLWEHVAVTLAVGGGLGGLDVHGPAEGGPAVVGRGDREGEHVRGRVHRALRDTDRG